MELSLQVVAALSVLFFVVAFLYSSVGHGGASGYLAVMSFLALPPAQMATTALILNILVAGIAFISYFRAGHFSSRLTWPFLLTSIPAAFVGGLIKVDSHVYYLLLAGALIFAAYRLAVSFASSNSKQVEPPLTAALPLGAGIGILSGVIGVGGGIFLSPVMLLMKWADPKQTSATSAAFIIVNAIAGLAGRFLRGGIEIGPLLPLLVAGFIGGLLGSYLGANQFSGLSLRRILAIVLLLAAVKLVLQSV